MKCTLCFLQKRLYSIIRKRLGKNTTISGLREKLYLPFLRYPSYDALLRLRPSRPKAPTAMRPIVPGSGTLAPIEAAKLASFC